MREPCQNGQEHRGRVHSRASAGIRTIRVRITRGPLPWKMSAKARETARGCFNLRSIKSAGRDDERVEVLEKREPDQEDRRASPAPAPGEFGEEDRGLAPDGTEAVADWSGWGQGFWIAGRNAGTSRSI